MNERELAEALRRAIHLAIEEVAPHGGDRAISADTYADCLVALFLAASPQLEAPNELERLTELFLSQRWRGVTVAGTA